MDMYRNHGTSLSQGEGAMFGEYSTTPSKYGIKSRRRYTLSTDVIPSVSTEFGEYQKTTTEIGQDSVSNPLNGVYKNKMNIAAKLLDFGETTNTNGVNTNFDSSYDILQPKNSVVRESAQFGEYKPTTRKIVKKTGFTTSNDALSSKDIYANLENFSYEKSFWNNPDCGGNRLPASSYRAKFCRNNRRIFGRKSCDLSPCFLFVEE